MQKRSRLWLLGFVALLPLGLTAQNRSSSRPATAGDSPTNVLKINPISGLVRTLTVAYERKLGENSSAQLGFSYLGGYIFRSGGFTTRFRGYNLTPEYRYYFGEAGSLQGFFVGPFLRYQSLTLSVTVPDDPKEYSGSLTSFGGGVIAGGQFLLGENIALGVFVGPSFTGRTLKYDEEIQDRQPKLPLGFAVVGVRGGITLGFAFGGEGSGNDGNRRIKR